MITHTICDSFVEDLLRRAQDPENDSYYLALFGASAVLGAETYSYSGLSGEVSGLGYTAGGRLLTGNLVVTDSGKTILTFDSPVIWYPSTIIARGGLIYNNTLAGKNAVMAMDFGEVKTSYIGLFQVNLPNANASTGLIRGRAA